VNGFSVIPAQVGIQSLFSVLCLFFFLIFDISFVVKS